MATISREHIAADIATIWTKLRLIECQVRGGWNDHIHAQLDALSNTMIDLEQLIQRWESRIETPYDKFTPLDPQPPEENE